MSFNPRSDIVLEVLNAADPARAQLAAERLEALGANRPAADFAADLDRASAARRRPPRPPASPTRARPSPRRRRTPPRASRSNSRRC